MISLKAPGSMFGTFICHSKNKGWLVLQYLNIMMVNFISVWTQSQDVTWMYFMYTYIYICTLSTNSSARHVDYLSLSLGIPFMNMMILMFTWKNKPGKSETDHQPLTNQPATNQSYGASSKEPLARSWIHGPVMKRSSSSHISMLKRCREIGGKLVGVKLGEVACAVFTCFL